jgi:multiple sugar transport system substrate-binding protein
VQKINLKIASFHKVAVILVGAGAILAWSASALAADSVKPSPVKYPTDFGAMHFPKHFPDGTKLSITQWSHFVPSYDKWFDKYAQKWGEENNVDVKINHISYADLGSSLSSAIAANKGSTLYQLLFPPSSFIEGLQPLGDVNKAARKAFGKQTSVAKHSSYLPAKDMWYAFTSGWAPDPGDYRVSLWKRAGYPHGPSTYADLLKGASKIFKDKGIPSGGGLSPEIDAEYFARTLIWSFGGAIQDKNAEVVFDSPQTVKAVKWFKKYHKQAQTPEVFSWTAASNNQGFIAGQLSYIQNSISFYRSAQESHPKTVKDTGFVAGLKGPGGEKHVTAHAYFIYVMPKYVQDKNNKRAAKKFLLDLEANYSNATYYSKLYNFPAFPKESPQLFAKNGWLAHDPFGSKPADKLEVLRHVIKSSDSLGYPGYANPAIGQIYGEHLIPGMLAKVTRGKETPKEAVENTAAQMKKIFRHWREKGYLPKQSNGD